MVVIYHAGYYGAFIEPLPPGPSRMLLQNTWQLHHGVTLFFVISGYCISATAEATHRKELGLFSYFRRRVRRIFPPYWIVLAGLACIVGFAFAVGHAGLFTDEWPGAGMSDIPAPQSLHHWQWVGNITLTELWRPHVIGRGASHWLLGPAWTLCYEEQFYFVVGMLLLIAGRGRFDRFFAGALLVTGVTAALRWLPGPERHYVTGTFLDGAWLYFAAGILVYYDRNAAASWARRLGRLTLASALVWGAWTSWRELEVASAFALILMALARWDRVVMQSAWSRPFQLCGMMCYSLYLVHWPLAKLLAPPLHAWGLQSAWATLLVTVPIVTVGSLLLGWTFHRLVERRFLNTPMTVRESILVRSPHSEQRRVIPA